MVLKLFDFARHLGQHPSPSQYNLCTPAQAGPGQDVPIVDLDRAYPTSPLPSTQTES